MAVVTPDLPEIFEEAFERAGQELRSGYDLKTARRSFNLLTLEWQNRGLNLWTIASGTQSLAAGTATYTLRQTLLTFWNTSYARVVELIKRIRT